MNVRTIEPADREIWLRQRCELWPESSLAEHRRDVERFFRREPGTEPIEVLLAFGSDGAPLGFAELSIRPYADGCRTQRVAYLEGWYVAPAARRRGIGRALIEATERWAVEQGCSELASDTTLDNSVSRAAHRAVGFEEAAIIRCFRKDVSAGSDPS